MAPKYRMLLLFAIAAVVSYLIYWPVLKIAKSKNIVDKPQARKLQRVPVPVLGGIAVFFGIVVGLSFFKTMLSITSLFAVLTAMIVMLYLGTIDDVLNLSPILRLFVEFVVMGLLLFGTRYSLCNFQGLWGIRFLPAVFSVPLSVLLMVGIVNAINMIDGVDGLVSMYCIFALSMFGLLFFLSYDYSFAALAAVSVGALIPFLLHNILGSSTKMFIGDGGTMMIGTVLASMAIVMCKYRDEYVHFIDIQFGLLAFSLAVLAVPIFDMLRVMCYRIVHGKSPFKPDKNHLHHIFIDLSFSHIAISITEVILNMIVVAVWAAVWQSGASVSMQFYSVVITAFIVTFGVASFLKYHLKRDTKLCKRLRAFGNASNPQNLKVWARLQSFVDGNKSRLLHNGKNDEIISSVILLLFFSVPLVSSCTDVSHAPDMVSESRTDYSCIAVFGDLQSYSQEDRFAEYYRNSLNWLNAKQSTDSSVACILHTGDATDNNAGHQWRRFRKSTSIVSSSIPFYSSTGNHDYYWDSNQKITDRRTTYLNNYYDFPFVFNNVLAVFEQGKFENAVYRNYYMDRPLYLLFLEFAPRPEVLEWADGWLREHSDIEHILVTHEFLDAQGNLMTSATHAEKHFSGTGLKASKPEEVWDRLIRSNDNISVVLCGHARSFVQYREDENDMGRSVPQVLFNLQQEDNGGDGWVMLWNAIQGTDSVAISIYNTVRDEYYLGNKEYRRFRIFNAVYSK